MQTMSQTGLPARMQHPLQYCSSGEPVQLERHSSQCPRIIRSPAFLQSICFVEADASLVATRLASASTAGHLNALEECGRSYDRWALTAMSLELRVTVHRCTHDFKVKLYVIPNMKTFNSGLRSPFKMSRDSWCRNVLLGKLFEVQQTSGGRDAGFHRIHIVVQSIDDNFGQRVRVGLRNEFLGRLNFV